MKIFFCFFAVLMGYGGVCFSQDEVYIGNLSGPPMKKMSYTNISGSPYLFDDWTDGVIYLTRGVKVSNVKLMYDESSNELNFKYPSAEPMKLVEEADSFKVNQYDIQSGRIVTSTFVKLMIGNTKQFLQSYGSHSKDSLRFLVLRRKKMYVMQDYNSASKRATFEKAYEYFIQDGDNLTKIKLKKEALDKLSLYRDHKDKVETFIKDNQIKISDSKDFAKTIMFLNGLK